MSVLVIGGAGFVGSHLVDELLTQRMEVMLIDDLSTGKLDNIARWKGHDKLDFVRADAIDPVTMVRMVQHKDWVFNFMPIDWHDLGKLLRACLDAGVKRVVDNTGTGAVGDKIDPPVHLTLVSLQLDDVYGPRGPREGKWFVSDVVRANMVVAMDRSYRGVFPLSSVVYWPPVSAEGGRQIIELYEKNNKPSLVIASR